MAISETYTFNPDISEIVEEAYERAGLEMRTGYDIRTARRSLNILTLEWQNRGLNLWTIDEITWDSVGDGCGPTTTLTKGTATYNLRSGTISLLDAILRTNDGELNQQADYRLNRISQPTYSTIPNKLTQARPLQYYMDRKEILGAGDGGVDQYDTITLWPVPDESLKYTLIYWRMRRIADAGNPASNTMQIPSRFIPALISGLAYYIAMKKPEAQGRLPFLKEVYEEDFRTAADEDRVKASVRFVPQIPWY